MERKTNISVWQLRLFEGLDKDIMVMQRDEEEVFENAIHVFFDKEYYDAYVSKAKRYSNHRYAYHEDKLGEVIYQIFDEKITGMVLHISTSTENAKNVLCDEKYLSAKDLLGIADAAQSYHYLYTCATNRMSKEETVAKLWNKDVFIIGHLPDFRNKSEKQTIELMTMKRKADASNATENDFDYEALKIFLTAESAMKFNPDKKPVNRYKLSLLANFVKGKFRVIIEPHRNYWVEFDPAAIDISEYYQKPVWNEEKVKERIKNFAQLEEVYILLAAARSDYRKCIGTPMLVKLDEQNVMLYAFEKYDEAVKYVVQNPGILPVFDGTYPIGVLKKDDKLVNLHTILAVGQAMGVGNINLDMDTPNAIGCKIPFFMETLEWSQNLEDFLESDICSQLVTKNEDGVQCRFPAVPFVDDTNIYNLSDEKKQELISHIDNDEDMGVTYFTGCTIPEMICILNEVGRRFDKVRTDNDEDGIKKYNKLLNQMTIPLTETLCEKPYIYTLRESDGSFTLKNKLPYLIVTNRFESGRSGEGRLVPAGVENEHFMQSLEETSKVVVITDGPNSLCLADVRLMSEVAKQRKKSEVLREELIIYMTQGCDITYDEAVYYYKKLKLDNSIFVEFTATVRNGEFPPMGMITVDGKTAKSLAEKNQYNLLQAYNALFNLKYHIEDNKKEAVDKTASQNESFKEESSNEESKGFFGKLFKK